MEKNEIGGACGTYGGKMKCAYWVLVWRQGRRPLGRPRRRWEGNIKSDLQAVAWGYVDWSGLAQALIDEFNLYASRILYIGQTDRSSPDRHRASCI